MEQITEANRPRCIKCEQPAICYMNRMWICGNCLIKLQEKVDKLKKKLLLEE